MRRRRERNAGFRREPRKCLLVFMHAADVTGPAVTLRSRLQELAASYDVVVVFPKNGPAADLYSPFANVLSVPYERMLLPRSPKALAASLIRAAGETWRLARVVRRHQPSAVLLVTTSVPPAALAARLLRRPSATYAAELLVQQGDGVIRHVVARFRARLTELLSTEVICCSSSVASQFSGERVPVHVIHPGVGDEYASGDRSAGRQALSLDESAFVVLVAGALTPARGQDVALRAFATVAAKHRDATLLVAGEPHDNEGDRRYAVELRRLKQALELGDRVRFIGIRTDMPTVYAASDVVVNPALSDEGFGRVALEAVAAGRPVVASRIGALTRLFHNDNGALLVTPGAEKELADATLRLAGDLTLRQTLAERGQAVLVQASERDGISRFAEVVDRLAGGVESRRRSRC
jgi:glycosyltransferase involved in cell wall biosynthesis